MLTFAGHCSRDSHDECDPEDDIHLIINRFNTNVGAGEEGGRLSAT